MVISPRVPTPFGIYVHVPFCAARCGYCDFATWTDRSHLVEQYVDACVLDLARHEARGDLSPATSVFFGGGTPSLLPVALISRILGGIRLAEGAEVTVECNPDSVDPRKLAGYRAAGATRLSFGVQSLRPHVLELLERTHDPANVRRAVGWARDTGFETFNVDLIYGTPGESADDWRATLDGALALDPPHVSAYALTVEPGTPLGQRVARGEASAPDDDDQAAKYDVAHERLTAAGLEWYELSSWARPGHECRHNLLYWRGHDYLAVGCAAHGHRRGRRWWNVRTPERYIALVTGGGDPIAGEEVLDAAARAEEAFTLGLRTREGAVPPAGARGEVERLVAAGLLARDGPGVVLTRASRPLATDITARILAEAERPTTGAGAVEPGRIGTR